MIEPTRFSIEISYLTSVQNAGQHSKGMFFDGVYAFSVCTNCSGKGHFERAFEEPACIAHFNDYCIIGSWMRIKP